MALPCRAVLFTCPLPPAPPLQALAKQDPWRYHAVLCCDHVHISRTEVLSRGLVRIECLKPRTPARVARP